MIVRRRPNGVNSEYTLDMSHVEFSAMHAAVSLCKEIMTEDQDKNPLTSEEAVMAVLLTLMDMRLGMPEDVKDETTAKSDLSMQGSNQAG